MKIKNVMLVMLATATVFSSCSKEDATGIVSSESQDVVVKVSYESGQTKAQATDIGAAKLTLGPGYLFFTDELGTITRQIQIVSSGASGDDQKNVADFISLQGATITSVPNNSKNCYILSNSEISLTGSYTNQNISVITAMNLSVNAMYDATNGGVVNVPLWGSGAVTKKGNDLETEVVVSAAGSRIQVRQITGVVDIVSYKIDAIFVNNYFATMPVGGTLAAANVVNNGSDKSKYSNTTGGAYVSLPGLYDYDVTNGIANNTSAAAYSYSYIPKKTGSTVWAYNVFPNAGVPSASQATVPHIIIRLTDVVYNDGSGNENLGNPQFITVKGLLEHEKTDVYQSIQGGYVYTIENLRFQRKNLSDLPEVALVNATVTVDLVDWIPESVDPYL